MPNTTSNDQIRLNSIGFLPGQPKRASIAAPCAGFTLLSVPEDTVAFRGEATGPLLNPDTDEQLYLADFSGLTTPGTYRLDIPGVGRSAPFEIGESVYHNAYRTAMLGMYLWRCGTAVSAVRDGVTYSHEACHLDDAYMDFVGGGHTQRDAARGWHDAGDYNKYIVNSGVTLGTLFMAWQEFGPRIEHIPLDLPESGNGLPDFLNEMKWNMDWVLAMQARDGSVYHKLSTKDFCGIIMPEDEDSDRYFAPWSSAATADFTGMAAMAARAFEPYDRAYAKRCLEAATKSYLFLGTHPGNHAANLTQFTTGEYQKNGQDDRLWAAAEMWETTGSAVYLNDFETHARAFAGEMIEADWGWGNIKNLGMLTYLFSKKGGRNAALVEDIRESLLSTADGIVRTRNAHGYARTLGTKYYWGANGSVASQTVLLQAANRISPNPDYIDAALDALGYLLGRNYYGRSFVTGVGANPPQHPHHRPSEVSDQPWPGYLVGGGWPKATDWLDESSRFDLNEVAINWNAPLIYALASFLKG